MGRHEAPQRPFARSEALLHVSQLLLQKLSGDPGIVDVEGARARHQRLDVGVGDIHRHLGLGRLCGDPDDAVRPEVEDDARLVQYGAAAGLVAALAFLGLLFFG